VPSIQELLPKQKRSISELLPDSRPPITLATEDWPQPNTAALPASTAASFDRGRSPGAPAPVPFGSWVDASPAPERTIQDLFKVNQAQTPQIGAPPRGQAMTPPPPNWLSRQLEPSVALGAGVIKGAMRPAEGAVGLLSGHRLKGNIDPLLGMAVPDLEAVRERQPIPTGVGEFAGYVAPISGAGGLMAKIPGYLAAPMAAQEGALGAALGLAESEGDPIATLESALGFPLVGGALRGAGKVLGAGLGTVGRMVEERAPLRPGPTTPADLVAEQLGEFNAGDLFRRQLGGPDELAFPGVKLPEKTSPRAPIEAEPPVPATQQALETTFNLRKPQARAAELLLEQHGLDRQRILASVEKASEDALYQLKPEYAEKMKAAIAKGDPKAEVYKKAVEVQELLDQNDLFWKYNPEKKWLESNAEYWRSVDPDLICQRSEGTDAAVNYLKKVLGKLYKSSMGWEIIGRANEQGLQTPCRQCYVVSARTKSGNAMQKRYIIGLGGYAGEVGKMRPSILGKLQAQALRHYSSTDFKAEHIPGLLAEHAEAAEKGIPFGSYTKQADYVHIFGPSGSHINVSVGRDIDVGMNWDEAMALREKFPNVGSVYIAFTDEEVLWALRNPQIDHVIPLHISGQPLNVLKRRMRDFKIQDYTRSQSERNPRTGKNAGKHLKIKDWEHGGDLAKYLQLVEDRGLIKKFPQFYDALSAEEKNLYMKLIGPEYGKFGGKYPYEPVKAVFDYDAIPTAMENRLKTRMASTGEFIDIAKQIEAEVKDGTYVAGDVKPIVKEGPVKAPKYVWEMTPEELKNYANGNVPTLEQKGKGAVDFAEDGKAIIRGFEAADISTFAHETAHVARRFLFDRNIPLEKRLGITDDHIQVAEEFCGVKEGVWTVEAEERFARAYERYLSDGQAPSSKLAELFEAMKKWMGHIYQQVTGSEIDINISPDMRAVFDDLFTRKQIMEGTAPSRLGELRARQAETPKLTMPGAREPAPIQNIPSEAIPPEPPVPQVVPPPAAPPRPEDVIGMSYAQRDLLTQVLRDTELLQKSEFERRPFKQALADAQEQGYDKRALEIAREVTKNTRPISDAEQAGMALRVAEVSNEIDRVTKEIGELSNAGNEGAASELALRREAMFDEISDIVKASDLASRENARGLNIRKMLINRESMKVADVVLRARAVKGTMLDPKEMKLLETSAKRYADLETEVKELRAKWEESLKENEKLRAEKIVKRQAAQKRIAVSTEAHVQRIRARRADIKKQLQALGAEVRLESGGGGQVAETAWLVGKLAATYVEEGVVNLADLVQKVKADIPGITDREVWQAMNTTDPKQVNRVRAATERKMSHLRTQARLLVELEDAEKGFFKERKAGEPRQEPEEIRALRTKLRELKLQAYRTATSDRRLENTIARLTEAQNELTNRYRTIKKKIEPPQGQLKVIQDQLQEARRALYVEDELARLQDQLATGNLQMRPRPEPKQLPPELERKEIELRMARKEIRMQIEARRPLSRLKKWNEGLNVLRQLKATADMSGVLRQGFPLIAPRPFEGLKAFRKAFGATFSEFKSEQVMNAIEQADHHYIRQRAKLYISDPTAKLAQGEEYFLSNLVDKVPVVGEISKASERNMVTFLNLMRVAAFDEFYAKFPNATREELAAWAHFVNVMSGRGDTGLQGKAAAAASALIFAPKFAASRIQGPFMPLYYWKLPRVRNMAARDIAATFGLGMTALGLMALAGGKLTLDPQSADWGKARFGDTRIDLWGGFQQPMRIIARLVKRGGIKGLNLFGTHFKDEDMDPKDMLMNFAAYKIAPSLSMLNEYWTGKNMVGDEIEPVDELFDKRLPFELRPWMVTSLNAMVPMIFQDIADAYGDGGVPKSAFVAPISFFGGSASTYESGRKKSRKGHLPGKLSIAGAR
jgi:hypothetical protein